MRITEIVITDRITYSLVEFKWRQKISHKRVVVRPKDIPFFFAAIVYNSITDSVKDLNHVIQVSGV